MTTVHLESTRDEIDEAIGDAHSSFARQRPRSRELHEQACRVLPGGNTRSVLYHPPFPLRISRAWDAVLEDIDGYQYIDFLGEYSAGLYGHSHPVIAEAMIAALKEGISRGAHTEREVRLAQVMCDRFPFFERLRFTNSGTEANLMALSAARAFTGRDKIMVFRGGYHGGVLTFKDGTSQVNAPFEVVVGTYNDADSARELILQHASTLACVLVEPMLGSGGCVPGDHDFLRTLREVTEQVGSLLVFDEVMTSRTGRSGLQEIIGITADLTTVGKFIGGGSSFGAFGGRADIMEMFDPSNRDGLGHAGTFNNNVLSMAAGHAGLTQVYTADVAERHTKRGEQLREELSRAIVRAAAPFTVTGVGSLLAFHVTPEATGYRGGLAEADPRLLELLFHDLVEEGYYIAPRGYLALSLALNEAHLDGFVATVERVLLARRALYER